MEVISIAGAITGLGFATGDLLDGDQPTGSSCASTR